MSLVRGAFELTWGANTLTDIEEINVEYDHDSEDYKTVGHQTYEVDGAIKVSVSLTLLRSDVASLAAVLPQYYVANGGVLSTGETVTDEEGAIDVTGEGCEYTYNDLEIESCGTTGQVMRLVNARTKIEDIENDDKLRKVIVKFVGEPDGGVAAVQFFVKGGISEVS